MIYHVATFNDGKDYYLLLCENGEFVWASPTAKDHIINDYRTWRMDFQQFKTTFDPKKWKWFLVDPEVFVLI